MMKNAFNNGQKKITVLVHTESILNDHGALDYFIMAGKLSPISILFMPMIHSSSKIPCETGRYIYEEDVCSIVLSLVFPGDGTVFSTTFGEGKRNSQELAEKAERYILSGNFPTQAIDYIVTNQKNVVKRNSQIPIITYEQSKEILRLFLIHTNQYEISEHFSVDEFFYYIYKHKALFFEFQNYWKAVCEDKKIDDWANALDKRLELITVCFDKCMIELNKIQNNCTAMHLQYHLTYLMLLVTGTFDNLAWIINTKYELGLNKLDVGLRNKKFLDKVKGASMAIYEKISCESFVDESKAIKEVRDRIVHRQFIQTCTGGNACDRQKDSYLFVDRAVYDLLKKAGLSNTGETLIAGNEMFILLEAFIDFIKKVVVRNVNELLRIIAEEQYGAKDSYVIWDLLGFPCEPYVL